MSDWCCGKCGEPLEDESLDLCENCEPEPQCEVCGLFCFELNENGLCSECAEYHGD